MKMTPAHTSVVVPVKPIREHWLPLSNLDRVVMPTYVRVLLVYNIAGAKMENSGNDLMGALKNSLAKVLVDFYPMAGRLGVQDDGLVNIHCNGAGAIFIEAFVDEHLKDIDLASHIGELSGLNTANLGEGPVYVPSRDFEIPPLVIQVTRFQCENVVVAVNWHHTVADIYSGCHFLKSWGELAIGQTQPSLRPCHSRQLVRPRDELDSSLAERWARLARVNRSTTDYVEDPPFTLRAFDISYEPAEKLREKVDQEALLEGTPWVSFSATDRSILAHMWRLMAKARRAEEPDDEDNASRLFMFVEGRKFLNLPGGYFGNVVGCACARSTEENLTNGSLSDIARLIQSALAEVGSHEFFQSLIDWVEAQRLGSTRHEQGLSMEHYVAATLWTFAPLYEVDLGWGKPRYALTNPAPRRLFDSLVILPGPHHRGGKTALMQIRNSCLDRLTDDEEFNSLYAPGCFTVHRELDEQSAAL